MNKTVLFYGAITLALISLCFLFLLRIVPSAQIWDKYNVLYVDTNVNVQEVKHTLETEGITDVLYPDHSPFPIPSILAPVQHHQFASGISYEQLQSSYFFDRDQNYTLYYIPQQFVKEAQKALNKVTFSWGIDIQATIPAIPCIITLILTIILVYFSKNKSYFLSIQIPFILYTIAAPFFHVAATVCICTLANFVIQKYWNRKYFLQSMRKNIFTIVACSLLFVGSFLLGLRGFVLLLCTVSLIMSTMYLLNCIKQKKYESSLFQPIFIHSSKTVRIQTYFNSKFVLIASCAIFLLTVLAIVNIQPQKKNTQKALHIPSPSGYTITDNFSAESYEQTLHMETFDRLPDLTDFVSSAWHFETYPYVKLSNDVTNYVLPGESIEQIEYIRNGNIIEEKTEVIAQFDDAYIQRIISTALTRDYAGAEKLLANQKGFSRVTYSEAGTVSTPMSAILFLFLMCAFMAYVLIVLKMKRQ